MRSNYSYLSAAIILLLVAGFCLDIQAQGAAQFVGTYRIDIPGKTSTNTTRERIDSRSVLRTDTTTIGRGASGAGTLEVRSDGTYAIRDHIGYGKLKAGKWIFNDEGPFSDKGGIELLEVKSSEYGKDQTSWYIFINNDGEVEAREPPYTTYNSLRLTKTGGGAVGRPQTGRANAPSTNRASLPAKTAPSPKAEKKRELTQDEIYKLQRDIVSYFTGKTQSQIEAVLGKAKGKNDQDGYSQEFSLENADLPIENFGARYKTMTVQFDAPPARGGKVKTVNLW